MKCLKLISKTKEIIIGNLISLFLGIILFGCTSQRSITDGVIINENTEWSNTWIVGTNDTIRPKVLLIGDSHVERYYNVVTEKLGNKVSCSKFTTSKSLGDPTFLKQLESVLMICNFDIISFNNGLHGVDYSVEEYSKFAQIASKILKQNARKSVIWVNSTAIREKDNISKFGNRNKQIIERNNFLFNFTEANNITLVDFYSETVNRLDYYSSDGIHFNSDGVKKEAELIIWKINEIMKLK